MKSVLSNLFDNALEALGESGRVTMSLFCARKCRCLGGEILLASIVEQGTEVALRLPCAAPPAWSTPALNVLPGTQIVVIDDDPSIHEVWKSRFRELDLASRSVEVVHYTNLRDLEQFCEARRAIFSPILYLCDFEFRGSNKDDLAAIECLGIATSSVLVTSSAEESALRAPCTSLGVKLLPKSMASIVPLRAI